MLFDELTKKILEAGFEVSKELGSGFLESVYEKALLVALRQNGLNAASQVPLQVKFRGAIVGEFYADILVKKKVLLELKAVSRILPAHKAQVINYLEGNGNRNRLIAKFRQRKIRI